MEQCKESGILTGRVIGAAIEVHKHLGPGYLESVYAGAFAEELAIRGLSFVREYPIHVAYKGTCVGQARIDMLVHERLVVELKAVECLLPVHKAQVISYLRMTRLNLGLLINFNVPVLRRGIQRIILSK